jgi:Protein of unknown function (DUF3489)
MPRTTPARPIRRPATQSRLAAQSDDTAPPSRRSISQSTGTGRKPVDASTADAPAECHVADALTSDGGRVSKLDRLIALLKRPDGASLSELTHATGWQAHSVRGAIAGSLKRKGHVVTSEKIDGIRRYRIEAVS